MMNTHTKRFSKFRNSMLVLAAGMWLAGLSTLVHADEEKQEKSAEDSASSTQAANEPGDRSPASPDGISDETANYLRRAGAKVEKIFDNANR